MRPIASTTKTLLKAHNTLWQNTTAGAMPAVVSEQCKNLQTHLLPLLQNLTQEEKQNLIPDIAQTLSADVLLTLTPQDTTPWRLSAEHYPHLLSHDADIFKACVQSGLKPPTREGKLSPILDTLVKKCKGKEKDVWAESMKNWLLAYETPEPLLSYCRDLFTTRHPLPKLAAATLTQTLFTQIQTLDDKGESLLLEAVSSSSTPITSLLILLGVPLCPSPHFGGKKAHAILDACSTAHGRIAFTKRWGPADTFLFKRETPDLRT